MARPAALAPGAQAAASSDDPRFCATSHSTGSPSALGRRSIPLPRSHKVSLTVLSQHGDGQAAKSSRRTVSVPMSFLGNQKAQDTQQAFSKSQSPDDHPQQTLWVTTEPTRPCPKGAPAQRTCGFLYVLLVVLFCLQNVEFCSTGFLYVPYSEFTL